MRRSHGVLLVSALTLACAGGSAPAPLPRAQTPARPSGAAAEELPALPEATRTPGGAEVRIAEPSEGSVLDPDAARSLTVVVRLGGPPKASGGASHLLSLDGARPRPVRSTSLPVTELLDPDVALAPGAHDLVLSLVDISGVAFNPSLGSVASVRFYVGAPPREKAPPRLVCLGPFGTVYGSAPRIVLDFVTVAGPPMNAIVDVEGGGSKRRSRASGPGPFALGDFSSGDYRVTVMPEGGPSRALPCNAAFTVNAEIERAP